MRISELSPDEAVAALRGTREGLTSAEAQRRLAEFGANRLEEARRLLVFGVVFEIALIAAIVYTPWGQAFFGTAALPAEVWLFMLPFAAAMVALEELRKAVLRRRHAGD